MTYFSKKIKCHLIYSRILSRFLKNKDNNHKIIISPTVTNEEKIVRGIYSPINLKKDGTLKSNAFKSPGGIDEVSVLRLNYTDPDFCKKHCKSIENIKQKRKFHGLAVIDTHEIISSGAAIIASPLEKIPFHADIKIGYIVQPHESLPAEFNAIINKLAAKARFYLDKHPESENWLSDELV